MSGLSHTHEGCLFFRKNAADKQTEERRRLAKLETHIWRLSEVLGKRYYILVLVQNIISLKALDWVLQQPPARDIFKGALDSKEGIVQQCPYFNNPSRVMASARLFLPLPSNSSSSGEKLFTKRAEQRVQQQFRSMFHLVVGGSGGSEEILKDAYIIQEDGVWKNCVVFNEMLVLDLGNEEVGRELNKWRTKALRWSKYEVVIQKGEMDKSIFRFAFREWLFSMFAFKCKCGLRIMPPSSLLLDSLDVQLESIFIEADKFFGTSPHHHSIERLSNIKEPRWIALFDDEVCPGCGKPILEIPLNTKEG